MRYSGISFVYQFSGIFASGITPLIATALLAQGGGQPWLICMYVMFAAVVSAVCAWLISPVPVGHDVDLRDARAGARRMPAA